MILQLPESLSKEKELKGHDVFISPLSVHIFFYLYKQKVPSLKFEKIEQYLSYTPFDQKMVELAFRGPTSDFEDNVQLHSSTEADCDFFLTEDRKLLDLKFFGKTRVVSSLDF